MSAPAGLADFLGSWLLTRTIDDRLAGHVAGFSGTARLTPTDDGALYVETGRLMIPGQAPLEATRRFLWAEAGPGRIAVAFDGGRAFHDFSLAASASASHDCPPDVYHAHYDFAHWPDWQATWTAKGPRKDYRMVSHYQRAP